MLRGRAPWGCNVSHSRYSTPLSSRLVVARFFRSTDIPTPQVAQTIQAPLTSPTVLTTAEHDLAEHCSLNPELGTQCWGVHEWFVHKCEDAEAAFALGQHGGATAEDYYRLQQTLRELADTGSMSELYHQLQMMKRMEERRAEGSLKKAAPSPFESSHAPRAPEPASLPVTSDPETRALLIKLFQRADADGNGRLSWSEFNKALAWIGDSMCEDDTELVSGALDLQGSVTLDQFLAIVEKAEEARSAPACDAQFLRHLTHQHPSTVDHIHADFL